MSHLVGNPEDRFSRFVAEIGQGLCRWDQRPGPHLGPVVQN